MDAMKTHGAFSWSELTTTDPAKAAEFYGSLFGWTVESMDMPMGVYRVAKIGGQPIGGIMTAPPNAGPVSPHWGCYVTVDSVDATVDAAPKLGGKVLMPIMEVTGVGRMAVLQDPQGAVINVISYNKA
ncbi:MAG: VOC family protein [Paucibacter sp.]|nr:VOC family protein [Roseateles sp.]